MSWGICDGVTTNPTICLNCGIKGGIEAVKAHSLKIAELIKPRPLSVEVTSDQPEEIIRQAKQYADLAPNIAVKVTITDRKGNPLLWVIHKLAKIGIRINVTAMMTFKQMILAAQCLESARQEKNNIHRQPTHFISLFAGRVADEQDLEQSLKILCDTREWLDRGGYSSKIIVGSIRQPENVDAYAKSGAHILTIPPAILEKCLTVARSKETVSQFLEDAQKALKTKTQGKEGG